MAENRTNKIVKGRRPRSKEFLRIDLNNAYAEVGVSPLDSTDEIAKHIAHLRGQALRSDRAGTTRGASEFEEEIRRLDEIHDKIGSTDARKKYDEKYPQNIFLTLQPSETEQSWTKHRLDGLITEWLLEELEEDAVLPSANCLKFWLPQGIDDELQKFLANFTFDGEARRIDVKDELVLPVLPDDWSD